MSQPSSLYGTCSSDHLADIGTANPQTSKNLKPTNVLERAMDPHSKRPFDDITNQREETTSGKLLLVHSSQNQSSLQSQHERLGAHGMAVDGSECTSVNPTHSRNPFSCQTSWVDIDEDDVDDQMACTEYVNDIFEHLRQKETTRRPLTQFMEVIQTDINAAMRSILVDWLVEVGMEYRLTSDTLFLSAAYIDRYLSKVDVKRSKLQLVGVTAMLIASKYEEIYAPQLEEFCYITDNTYSRESVIAMERDMLQVLDYELTQPTTKTFLRRYIKAASGEIPLDVTFEFLCSYLAELTLMEYGMLNYLPSHIAASITLLALFILNKPRWSTTLTHYSGYNPCELKHCTQAIHQLFLMAGSSSLPAIRDKYSAPKYGSVSLFGASDVLPEWLFQ